VTADLPLRAHRDGIQQSSEYGFTRSIGRRGRRGRSRCSSGRGESSGYAERGGSCRGIAGAVVGRRAGDGLCSVESKSAYSPAKTSLWSQRKFLVLGERDRAQITRFENAAEHESKASRRESSTVHPSSSRRDALYANLTSKVLSAPSAPAETSWASPFQMIDETPPRCLPGHQSVSVDLGRHSKQLTHSLPKRRR